MWQKYSNPSREVMGELGESQCPTKVPHCQLVGEAKKFKITGLQVRQKSFFVDVLRLQKQAQDTPRQSQTVMNFYYYPYHYHNRVSNKFGKISKRTLKNTSELIFSIKKNDQTLRLVCCDYLSSNRQLKSIIRIRTRKKRFI